MTAHMIAPSEYRKMPWKNGRGSTLEIFAVRDDMDFLWRLSLATIEESGPFSHFPDHERILIPLDGDMIQIVHDSKPPTPTVRFQPYRFDGAAQTSCVLAGKHAVDFNVMTTKTYGASDAKVGSGDFERTIDLKRARHACIYVYHGAAEILIDGLAEKMSQGTSWVMQNTAGMTQKLVNVRGTSDSIVVMVTVS